MCWSHTASACLAVAPGMRMRALLCPGRILVNYYGEHSYSWESEESLSTLATLRAQRTDTLKAWGKKVPGR